MAPSLLALLAALAFALGSTLQQRGTFDTAADASDPRFLLQILREPIWLAGSLLQGLGTVVLVIALAIGNIVVVQSIATLTIVFALPMGVRLTGQHVDRLAVVGAVATVLGIVTFLVVGQPQEGTSQPTPAQQVAWSGVIAVAMALLTAGGWRTRGPVSAVLFATAAGTGFGLASGLIKVFADQVDGGVSAILSSPATYLLAVVMLAGFTLQQTSLKTGFLAPSVAAIQASTLGATIVVSMVLFGSTLAGGGMQWGVALIALAVTVAGIAVLARPEDGSGHGASHVPPRRVD